MIGLIAIGLYCVLSSLLGVDFAKLHLCLPFLNFPIFSSEIVMSLCMGLCAWRIGTEKIRLTTPQRLFLGYLGFILLWAAYDYFKAGGLALTLRNAVLFFYPVFAFMAYVFYVPSFFSRKIVQIGLMVLLFSLYTFTEVSFFRFIYFLLFLALLLAFAQGRWRYILVTVALVFWPYGVLFAGSRTSFVSSIAAGLFLIFAFCAFFIKARPLGKILCGLAASVVFLGVASHYADQSGLATLITPKKVIEGYQEVQARIRERKAGFHPKPLTVHLYNAENNQQALSNVMLQYEKSPEGKVWLASQASPAIPAEGQLHAPIVPGSAVSEQPAYRDENIAYNNIYFRLLIWQDMLRELRKNKSIFGVGLAEPQRSRNIEILNWADGEWSRDGWITPHNSYLHMIYRGGIIGLVVMVVIAVVLAGLIKAFIEKRSAVGVLLSGALIYGLAAANFLLILELPYYAIPLWTLFGLTLAYRRHM